MLVTFQQCKDSMKEYPSHDPIQARMDALPFIVRDYLELSDEAHHTHDAEHKAQVDEALFGLVDVFTKEHTQALGEFVIFRNDTLKARGVV